MWGHNPPHSLDVIQQDTNARLDLSFPSALIDSLAAGPDADPLTGRNDDVEDKVHTPPSDI